MEFWNFYMCKPYIDENLDAWILVHNLCKDIWKTGERTDGQTYATTIPLCQNWPGVIKTQMAFHNYQSGLLFMCIDANVFIIDSWHNCNHYFRQLRRSAWVSFLSYLFTMAHLQLRDSSPDDLFPMKYNMLITNFVEIYFVTKRNWILKKREKPNEENEMKSFQSTYSVLLCGVGTFDVSVHYQHEIDPWRKICLNKKLYSPYRNRCLDYNSFCHRIAI